MHCVYLDRPLKGTIAHNPRSNMNNSVGYATPTARRNRRLNRAAIQIKQSDAFEYLRNPAYFALVAATLSAAVYVTVSVAVTRPMALQRLQLALFLAGIRNVRAQWRIDPVGQCFFWVNPGGAKVSRLR